MIKTFINICRTSGERRVGDAVELEMKRGVVPGVLGPDAFGTGVHAFGLPLPNPRPQVVEARGRPPLVKNGQDEEHSVGESVLGFRVVFRQERGLSAEKVFGPGCSSLDVVKKVRKPGKSVIR